MRRRDLLMLAGSAALGPWRALAQQRTPRIAIFIQGAASDVSETTGAERWRAFLGELRKRGYVEGRTIEIARFAAEGHPQRYPEIAQEIARTKPDVAVATGTVGFAMASATQTIPVLISTPDPVGIGFAQNLPHPGKNITGVSTDAGPELYGKYVELLRAFLPHLSRVANLGPSDAGAHRIVSSAQAANPDVAVVLVTPESPFDEGAYRRAFALAREERADAIWVGPTPENVDHSPIIVALAAELRMPAIYGVRSFVDAGGLISYGYDVVEIYSHIADQAAAILKGENPGDIPIYEPNKFQLILNLKTAKALGIEMPTDLLVRADEVIE
jgi:putative tryptophan/tyrosine transport system substrate-binding protein